MTALCRRSMHGSAFVGLLLVAVVGMNYAASAGESDLASLVVEPSSGKVLHAVDANRAAFPASLTKLMTVYQVFEALERGDVTISDRWPVSQRAESQPPTGMGLESGETVSVEHVLLGLVVASANDASLVAAEALGGNEPAFVGAMNATAKALGMQHTVFRNASGLPDPEQRTTARDMAVLARALWLRFPDRRGLFAARSFQRAGRTEAAHNRFLGLYAGATGMKTGFTCRAGFNLVASASRNGEDFIGVVLGAATPEGRDREMRTLLDQAFGGRLSASPALDLNDLATAAGQGGGRPPPSGLIARTCIEPRHGGPSGWTIDVGVRTSDTEAWALSKRFLAKRRARLPGGRPLVIPRFTGGTLYRGCVTGLSQQRARDACLAYRREGGDCIIFSTKAARAQIEQVRRVMKLDAERRGKAGG